MEKPYLQIVTMGHVDSGKSTTLGHLMFKSGNLSNDQLDQLKDVAEHHGRNTFEYAFFFDTTKEERSKGVTIHLTRKQFETEKYSLSFIDAAGHSQYIKNTITGASAADVAMLFISAKEKEFEAGLKRGKLSGTKGGTTLEHASIAKVFGIKTILVLINKMDVTIPAFSKSKFNSIRDRITAELTNIGFKKDQLKFIPVSGLKGDNLVNKGNINWWKGDSLMQAINNLPEPSNKNLAIKPLRIPIQKVIKVHGAGNVCLGRVEYGTVKKGDIVRIQPFFQRGIVRSIEKDKKPLSKAFPPDGIGVCIGGTQAHYLKHGSVICVEREPCLEVFDNGYILARVVVLEHPKAIFVNYSPKLFMHTTSTPVRFVELCRKINSAGMVIEESPQMLFKDDIAEVKLVPQKPIALDRFKDFPQLGRFALRDGNITVAAGIVIDAVGHKKKE